jgi:glutathione synthase/RimK-type ligase-like ATP-grasp enzyme
LVDRGHEIELGAARGIWLRRPRWPIVATSLSRTDRAFAQQEAVAAIGGTWRVLAGRCISPPDAMQAARWKMLQLAAAAGLGLAVPESVVTNDPATAADFVSQGSTIAKAVAEVRVETEREVLVGETFMLDDAFDPDSVRPAPVLLQRCVDKVADVRVTAVGQTMFAVRIVTPEGAPLDFRQSEPHDCRYEVVILPDRVVTRLQAYLDGFGLRFGAFDFAEDRDSTLWFLECNPAGQWGWLEPLTGLDITGALIDLLMTPQA